MNSAMQRDASDINHAEHTDCKRQPSVDVCGAQALWPCSMNKHVYARIDCGGFLCMRSVHRWSILQVWGFFSTQIKHTITFHLVLFPRSDCQSQCRAVLMPHCRSLQAHSGPLPWHYKVPVCPASSCCLPQHCHSGSWEFPAAWIQSNLIVNMAKAVGEKKDQELINLYFIFSSFNRTVHRFCCASHQCERTICWL